MEWAILTLLPAAEHHRTLAGTHFSSHTEYEAELDWMAGYIPTDNMAAEDRTQGNWVASPTP